MGTELDETLRQHWVKRQKVQEKNWGICLASALGIIETQTDGRYRNPHIRINVSTNKDSCKNPVNEQLGTIGTIVMKWSNLEWSQHSRYKICQLWKYQEKWIWVPTKILLIFLCLVTSKVTGSDDNGRRVSSRKRKCCCSRISWISKRKYNQEWLEVCDLGELKTLPRNIHHSLYKAMSSNGNLPYCLAKNRKILITYLKQQTIMGKWRSARLMQHQNYSSWRKNYRQKRHQTNPQIVNNNVDTT